VAGHSTTVGLDFEKNTAILTLADATELAARFSPTNVSTGQNAFRVSNVAFSGTTRGGAVATATMDLRLTVYDAGPTNTAKITLDVIAESRLSLRLSVGSDTILLNRVYRPARANPREAL